MAMHGLSLTVGNWMGMKGLGKARTARFLISASAASTSHTFSIEHFHEASIRRHKKTDFVIAQSRSAQVSALGAKDRDSGVHDAIRRGEEKSA
jgi:hypothetical protein